MLLLPPQLPSRGQGAPETSRTLRERARTPRPLLRQFHRRRRRHHSTCPRRRRRRRRPRSRTARPPWCPTSLRLESVRSFDFCFCLRLLLSESRRARSEKEKEKAKRKKKKQIASTNFSSPFAWFSRPRPLSLFLTQLSFPKILASSTRKKKTDRLLLQRLRKSQSGTTLYGDGQAALLASAEADAAAARSGSAAAAVASVAAAVGNLARDVKPAAAAAAAATAAAVPPPGPGTPALSPAAKVG